MFDLKNKKKFIFFIVIAGVFIIYVLFSLFSAKPKIQEDTNIPWGDQGKTESTDTKIESYVTINEREINLSVASVELLNIIKNPKMELKSFGEYYIYDGFYVFPQRQIKIKKSFDRIINVVFFDEYKSNIIKGINVQTDSDSIIMNLGSPNYNENNLLAYKTKDYYIIFDTKNHQASAYLRNNEDLEVFWQYYKIYLQSGDLKKFISNTTMVYPSYTKYSYDSDGLELIYADLGIRLYFKEYDNENGIYLYSNYYNENEEFSVDNLKKFKNVNYKNTNLVMKEEIERIAEEQLKLNFSWPEKIYSDNDIYKNINVEESYLKKAREEEKEYKVLEKMDKYTVYFNLNSTNYTFSDVSIVSKIGNKNFNINTAKVADNLLLTKEYVFYSIADEGIFKININTGSVVDVYIGEGNLELKYIKDGFLYFDDVKIKVI